MAAFQRTQLLLFIISVLVKCSPGAITRLTTNPYGSYATGYKKGYINIGMYSVVVPDGNELNNREVLISGPGVKDSVDMVFNTNTMLFSNWDGLFMIQDYVYAEKPYELYYTRSDKMCIKKKYQKLGNDIIVVDRQKLEKKDCDTVKAKVENVFSHYLDYPFKHMLPEPDSKLLFSPGYPGGEYTTGNTYGTVYCGQYTLKLPPGDIDNSRKIIITGPGVEDEVTMRFSADTIVYGSWDGAFYLGDKVFTTEPKTLIFQKDDRSCVKNIYDTRVATIIIKDTILLSPEECFKIKQKVFYNLQQLIANPKDLDESKQPDKDKSNSNPASAPIQLTSTLIIPKSNQQSQFQSSSPSTSTITAASPAGSSVKINTITGPHPDNPAVTSTTHIINTQTPQQNSGQTRLQQSPQIQPGIQAGNFQFVVQPTASTPMVVNSGGDDQQSQVFVSPDGQVSVLVPSDYNTAGKTIVIPSPNIQPGQIVNLQPAIENSANQQNNVHVHSHNVNVNEDGTYNFASGSLLLQGLDPNAQLVLPEGTVRVSRSVQQEVSQPGVVIRLDNNGNQPGQEGNVVQQTTSFTIPTSVSAQNSNMQMLQHSTTFNVPSDSNQNPGQSSNTASNQPNILASSNFIIKQEPVKTNPQVYYIKSNSINGGKESSSNAQISQIITKSNGQSTVFLQQNQPTGQVPIIIQPAKSASPFLTKIITLPNGQNTDSHVVSLNQQPVIYSLPRDSSKNSINLNIDHKDGSITIQQTPDSKPNGNWNQASNQGDNNQRASSVINLMKSLELPKPINNLIVNIAENTNFHKKK